MGSERDPRNDDSGRTEGGFGPANSGGFGPPLDDFDGGSDSDRGGFGPPVNPFGPSADQESGPGWSVPAPPADRPDLGWRPAGESVAPASSAGPSGQFRAPENPASFRAPDTSESPVVPVGPDADATVRHRTPPAPPVDQQRWWDDDPDDEPPRRTEPGMSWADDPIAKRLAPGAPVADPQSSRLSVNPKVLAGAGAAALVLVLIVVVVAFSRGGGGDSGNTAAPPPQTTAALSCPATSEGRVTLGNGAGGTARGPQAILGFQYAFYVERNGARAREFVAQDSPMLPAEVIQQAIDTEIPQGTTHCVRITETAADSFDVDLTEHRPDGETRLYPQSVTTVERDGKVLIFTVRVRQ